MKILLGVTGSISAYKSLDLARSWVKKGHEVKVVLSKGAEEFVVPKVFRFLGCDSVYLAGDDFSNPPLVGNGESWSVLHVELAKWADHFCIAPMSANTLGKLSRGEAIDLLTSTVLAWHADKPITIFPAMNSHMLSNPITQSHIEKLKLLPNLFIHPTDNGLLACGDEGEGKLPTVDLISDFVESFNLSKQSKQVLITTGATLSPLDPIRYLTNASSGKTGFHLAKEALSLGYKVILVAGTNSTETLKHFIAHPNFKLVFVTTTKEMEKVVEDNFSNSDLYISSAAISDIEFEDTFSTKLKKDQITNNLPIKETTDILKKMIGLRTNQKIVGFAAETELTDEVLNNKMTNKPVDLLVGTKVHSGHRDSMEQQGFGNDDAEYCFFSKNEKQFMPLKKEQLAKAIFEKIM